MQNLLISSDNFYDSQERGRGKINRIVYHEIMAAVAAFDACDINQHNEVYSN